jgi:hypothetical protein
MELESSIFVLPSQNRNLPMENTELEELTQTEKPTFKKRLGQLGIAGVVFFTVKGLLWLIIPVLIAKGCIAE